MNTKPVVQSNVGWGFAALGILAALYLAAGLQIPPRTETGIRVVPWQAPDLEIDPVSIEEPVTSDQNR